MESINFWFVKKYNLRVYNEIVNAESLSKINIIDSGHSLRRSLEILCNELIKKYNLNDTDIKPDISENKDIILNDKINFFKYTDNRTIKRFPYKLIMSDEDKYYIDPITNEKVCRFNNPEHAKRKYFLIDFIKQFGNLCAHDVPENSKIDVNYENLIACFEFYHRFLKSYIGINANAYKFNPNFMPVGKYYYNNTTMPLSNEEKITTGCETEFIAKYIQSYNTNTEGWAIVRVYRKDKVDKNFISRANDTLLNANRRLGNAPNGMTPITIISSLDNTKSPFYIIAYEFNKKPYKLEYILNKLNLEERYKICYQISKCFKNLHTSKNPIYHRMLTKNSIFLCDYSNERYGWDTAVTNFYFSKIDIDNINTVFNNTIDAFKFIRSIDKKYFKKPWNEVDNNTNWAKWDIYSMGVLFREILVGSIEEKIISDDRLQAVGIPNEIINLLNLMIGLEIRQPDINIVFEIFSQYK